MSSEIVAALKPLTDAFAVLEIDYRVGGSVASSVYGVMRATFDIDLVANVTPKHAAPLAAMLGYAYYVDAELIHHAIRYTSSFNIIYLASMMKIDVFVLGTAPYDQSAFGRRCVRPLSAEDSIGFTLSTPEDVVIRKLEWHDRGGGASERQLEDVVNVLRVQGERLDLEYLARWAAELGVLQQLRACLARACPPHDNLDG